MSPHPRPRDAATYRRPATHDREVIQRAVAARPSANQVGVNPRRRARRPPPGPARASRRPRSGGRRSTRRGPAWSPAVVPAPGAGYPPARRSGAVPTRTGHLAARHVPPSRHAAPVGQQHPRRHVLGQHPAHRGVHDPGQLAARRGGEQRVVAVRAGRAGPVDRRGAGHHDLHARGPPRSWNSRSASALLVEYGSVISEGPPPRSLMSPSASTIAAPVLVCGNRRTPAARAASSTARAPPTFSRWMSSADPPTDAARWNTPSQPAAARRSESGSARSATTGSTPAGRAAARSAERTVARTGNPRARCSAVSAAPT
jgi:hypothetical protein